MPMFHDMHCHLDFIANGEEVAADAQAAGTRAFANTVTPEGWLAARERFSPYGNVAVGFGMHPWWVVGGGAEDEGQLIAERQGESQRAAHRRRAAEAEEAAREAGDEGCAQRAEVMALLERYEPAIIGEVGVDLGWQHVHSRNEQLLMFEGLARWAAQAGGRLLSVHSIRAAREVLDVLEGAGTFASCTCVFHWFTGPSDQLKRAVQAGCYFSCGKRMLATKKGRAYVKSLPVDRLLLETDAPPSKGDSYSFAQINADLHEVADAVAAIKGPEALETIARTSERLLDNVR